jgi:hypothetical protein
MRPLIKQYLEQEAAGAKEVINLLWQRATVNIKTAKDDLEEYGHLVSRVRYFEGSITDIDTSSIDALQTLAKIHGLTTAKKQDGNTGKLNEWLEQIKEAREKYGSE